MGNITVGGSGKTPFTIYLARLLKEMGVKTAVLSRGYKRTSVGTAIVSNGKEMLLTPDEAGDEPYLIASALKDVPVIVDGDRVRGGRVACELFSPQVILLDDGFQHVRLARDLDIVLVDSKRSLGNRRLLPAGILREPPASLSRAGLVIMKGRGENSSLEEVSAFKPAGSFSLRPVTVVNVVTGEEAPIDSLRLMKVVAVSAIASPASFIGTLEECGSLPVSTLAYPDHYGYDEADVLELLRRVEATGADAVITTEKDGVKLALLKELFKGIPLLAVKVEVDPVGVLEEILKEKFSELFDETT